ncbi:3-hydroxyisobutyryl-CoA hydrolase [Pandoraea terrae]|uniref:3-hydroxyisobutyryl-CoA hydrolase n=1 Tax=Pandoraea terrae TaxID=1537710 RepID=A0A5E4U8G9_9BURK|nr:enoyl-CoA hydratase/isomerase family protein [Pandoraea terrae]VVD95184.1 3-hydroxyisobutyryl-CoA hydrolase [Pandoraea terrae]
MAHEVPNERSIDEGVAQTQADADVLFRVVNRVAVISLNRPTALNALSHGMVITLATLFERCRNDDEIVAVVLRGNGDKAFCAGGDVRALHEKVKSGSSEWLQFFVDEYQLNYVIHTFPKPVVALLDGITMGGGMGLGQGAKLRVVTNRTRMAMPETRIGLFPDVGATRFLSAMPVELELYVGLTGVTLSGASALLCNLADVCVPPEWLATFEDRLQCMPVYADHGGAMAALRRVFEPPVNVVAHAALSDVLPLVTRHFNACWTVEEIVASLNDALEREASPEVRQWYRSTSEALSTHSPTMLKVTRDALLRGRTMTLAECFRMELDLMSRAVPDGDFVEGVRAQLIDKDGKPRWRPSTLDEVKEVHVRHFGSARWGAEAHPLAELGRR